METAKFSKIFEKSPPPLKEGGKQFRKFSKIFKMFRKKLAAKIKNFRKFSKTAPSNPGLGLGENRWNTGPIFPEPFSLRRMPKLWQEWHYHLAQKNYTHKNYFANYYLICQATIRIIKKKNLERNISCMCLCFPWCKHNYINNCS